VRIPSEIAQRFAQGELIAAIAQEESTGEVLMLAWMNDEALLSTLETKKVTYWSRSRNSLWTKGETSGNTQELVSIAYDCDADALLVKVHQQGAACHTGERSCFHREVTQ
jgi:phosphoribosyl-AMP cyclohydrolase